MRPIIIGMKDNGKIELTLDEFKKFMNEAYNQGYSDGHSSYTFTWANTNDKWWATQPYCTTSITTTCSNTVEE